MTLKREQSLRSLIMQQVVGQLKQNVRFWLSLVPAALCLLVRICRMTECFVHLWQMMISVTQCKLSVPLEIPMTIVLSE